MEYVTNFNVGGGWLAGWLAGSVIILPLCGLSCKQRLAKISDKLKFQDSPSVAKLIIIDVIFQNFTMFNC
jgi:hypothetical protein